MKNNSSLASFVMCCIFYAFVPNHLCAMQGQLSDLSFKDPQVHVARIVQYVTFIQKSKRKLLASKHRALIESRYPTLTLKNAMPVFEESVLKKWKEKKATHDALIRNRETIQKFKKFIILPAQFIHCEKLNQKHSQFNDYSQLKEHILGQLIEQFNYLESLEFPKSRQETLSQKIVDITASMSIEEIMQNRDCVLKLDSHGEDFKSLVEAANASYLKISDDQGNITYMPEDMVKEASILSNMVSDLGGKIPEHAISIPQCSSAIMRLIRDTQTLEHSLENLIEMANCMNYLEFSYAKQKPFHKKIDALCINAWKEISNRVQNLNPDLQCKIFCNPVVEYLKYLMVDTSDRKKVISCLSKNIIIFSPNNRMIVSNLDDYRSRNGYLNVWTMFFDGSFDFPHQNIPCQHNFVRSVAFSSDNKYLAVGFHEKDHNLKLFPVENNKIQHRIGLDNIPWLEGHSCAVNNIVFHPAGNTMVSADDKNNVLLWTKNSDDTINKHPIRLDCTKIVEIYSVVFSSNGCNLVCAGKGVERNAVILVWDFDLQGTISIIPRIHTFPPKMNYVRRVSFFPNSRKFIADCLGIYRNGIFLCDISHDDMKYQEIKDDIFDEYSLSLVSPDGKILLKAHAKSILLFTIYDDQNIVFDYTIPMGENIHSVAFSPDSTKIAVASGDTLSIFKLLTNEERALCAHITMDQALLLRQMIFPDHLDQKYDVSDYQMIPTKLMALLRKSSLISSGNFPITQEENWLRDQKKLEEDKRLLAYSLLPEEQQLLKQKKETIRSQFNRLVENTKNIDKHSKSYQLGIDTLTTILKTSYDTDPISKRAFIEFEKEMNLLDSPHLHYLTPASLLLAGDPDRRFIEDWGFVDPN